jgi:hypothetical protein
VNMSRTCCEASCWLFAPSGCVPLGRAGGSLIASLERIRVAKQYLRAETQNTNRGSLGNAVVGPRLTKSWGKNEAHFAELCFLVGPHEFKKLFSGQRGPLGQRTDLTHQSNDASDVVGWCFDGLVSKQSSTHHSPSHRFPVLKLFVVRGGFQGVGKGMTVIEDLAKTCFSLIAADNARLNFDGTTDDVLEGTMVAPEDS